MQAIVRMLLFQPVSKDLKILSAATVNASDKKATRIKIRFINYSLKVKHTQTQSWNVWLRFSLCRLEDFSLAESNSMLISSELRYQNAASTNCKER